MLSRSERTIDAASQEVLFYLYAADLRVLRDVRIPTTFRAGSAASPIRTATR
jgi:hypothetical protein